MEIWQVELGKLKNQVLGDVDKVANLTEEAILDCYTKSQNLIKNITSKPAVFQKADKSNTIVIFVYSLVLNK